MTKEEITARLQELAAVLGRDADISGSNVTSPPLGAAREEH